MQIEVNVSAIIVGDRVCFVGIYGCAEIGKRFGRLVLLRIGDAAIHVSNDNGSLIIVFAMTWVHPRICRAGLDISLQCAMESA